MELGNLKLGSTPMAVRGHTEDENVKTINGYLETINVKFVQPCKAKAIHYLEKPKARAKKTSLLSLPIHQRVVSVNNPI